MQETDSKTLSPEAVRTLVEGHRRFLAFLEARVESRAVAEDILQSAFVRGLERGSEIRDDESIVAWFYRVLRNAVIDHYRRRAATERAMDAWARDIAVQEQPPGDVGRELCGCITELLGTLKTEYREAIQVVDLEDWSLSELAERSGITAGNAAVRIHRARQALRKQVMKACGTCAEHGCLDCQCKSGRAGSCASEHD